MIIDSRVEFKQNVYLYDMKINTQKVGVGSLLYYFRQLVVGAALYNKW